MKIELTKELKAELLRTLKQGFLDTDKLDALTGRNSGVPEIDEEKLNKIEKILYPD